MLKLVVLVALAGLVASETPTAPQRANLKLANDEYRKNTKASFITAEPLYKKAVVDFNKSLGAGHFFTKAAKKRYNFLLALDSSKLATEQALVGKTPYAASELSTKNMTTTHQTGSAAAPGTSVWTRPPTDSPTKSPTDSCHVPDADGFKLAVNIKTDLGPNFNGYTYNTNDQCPTHTANYGIGISSLGLDEKTIFKLSCTESGTGASHNMYIAGFSGGGTNAFSAAGRPDSDGSTIVCSNNADLSNPLFGGNCYTHMNGQHTYWGHSSLDMMWALYSNGHPYTLRHCDPNTYDAQPDTGSISYKRSTAALPTP